jgi:hypothetical protein
MNNEPNEAVRPGELTNNNEALGKAYFRSLGLKSIKTRYQELCLSG